MNAVVMKIFTAERHGTRKYAPLRDKFQGSIEHPKERRLTATRRAENRGNLAMRNRARDVPKHNPFAVNCRNFMQRKHNRRALRLCWARRSDDGGAIAAAPAQSRRCFARPIHRLLHRSCRLLISMTEKFAVSKSPTSINAVA